MDSLILKLEAMRKRCLVFASVSAVSIAVAAVSALVSVNTAEFMPQRKIFGILAAVLFLSSVVFFIIYSRLRKAYDREFILSMKNAAVRDEFPDAAHGDFFKADTSAIAALADLTGAEASEAVTAVRGTVRFTCAQIKQGEVFDGLAFVFDYGRDFPSAVEVRRKGCAYAKAAETAAETATESEGDAPLRRQETGNAVFDYTFIAAAKSKNDALKILNDTITNSFLTLNKKTGAGIAASFSGSRFCLMLNRSHIYYEIPLFTRIKKEKVKENLLSDMRAAFSLADDIAEDMRIWRTGRH